MRIWLNPIQRDNTHKDLLIKINKRSIYNSYNNNSRISSRKRLYLMMSNNNKKKKNNKKNKDSNLMSLVRWKRRR